MAQSSGKYSYEISVRTGDRNFSGTDADVFITLHGQGYTSKKTELDCLFKNDFEKGQTDRFAVKDTPVPKVESIKVSRGSGGVASGWFVVVIEVKNLHNQDRVEFPVLRWIKGDVEYEFLPLDTCLPQQDPRTEQRQRELANRQKEYYFQQWWPALPKAGDLPTDEQFSAKRFLNIFGTNVKLHVATLLKRFTLKEFRNAEDIKDMYSSCGFETPTDLDIWHDDSKFAMQRLTGVNMRMIALCTQIPDKMGVTSKMVEPSLEGNSLSKAVADKRIFIVDHASLDKLRPQSGIVVCAPIALFYQQNNGTLMPIAIQLFQSKGEDNPVFLPTDDHYTWILAKMWFNNADAQVHESVMHLGNTHLFMENALIASERNLSLSHPIYKLLKPHFWNMMAINNLAIIALLNKPDGFFNITMSLGTDLGLHIIHQNRSEWRLDVEGTLPADLKNRGVDDPKLLPNYFYREDGTAVYNAIKRYVTDYVGIYYTNEKDLLDDNEIQAWRAALVGEIPNGGGMKGVPGTNGKFTKNEELIVTLTSIMFTCSAEHAAVNFGQYEQYGFPLNYPSIMHGTPPKDKKPRSMDDLMKSISKPKEAMEGNVIFTILSDRTGARLGDFLINYIYDPKAKAFVDNFREDLDEISKRINSRESKKASYEYLNPSNIPNSINI